LIASGYSNKDQFIFLRDFTLDLSNSRVSLAFNQLIKNALNISKQLSAPLLALANPFRSHASIESILKIYFKELDDLYLAESEKTDHFLRAVDRNFSGANSSKDSDQVDFAAGVGGAYRVHTTQSKNNNKLEIDTLTQNKSNLTQYYFFPTWTHSKEDNRLLSRFLENTYRSANIIYETDAQFNIKGFKSIGFYYNYSDKTYDSKDHKLLLEHYKEVLPPTVYDRLLAFLRANNIETINHGIKNVRVESKYFIDTDGLTTAEKRFGKSTPEERTNLIRTLILDYLTPLYNSNKLPKLNPSLPQDIIDLQRNCPAQYKHLAIDFQDYCNLIEEIAQSFSVILQELRDDAGEQEANETALLRHKKIDALTKNSLFTKFGPGIMFQLIPAESILDSAHFEIKIYQPAITKPIVFIYPINDNDEERSFYSIIVEIQRVMDEVTPDLRVYGNDESITTKRGN
ncbi:MAG: hypothetical protein ABL927_09070, partial [Bdellovibrionales bacterium]